MMGFQAAIRASIALLLTLLAADIWLPVSHWAYVLAILVLSSTLVCALLFIDSGLHVRTICSGRPDRREIALTFDDGPDEWVTPRILEILRRHRIKATFFCIGKRIVANHALLRRIVLDGHTIGNHTYSHSNFFGFYGERKVARDLARTAELLKLATGKRPELFRPPFGVINPPIARAARQLGYTIVGWSVRSLDTVIKDEERLLCRLRQKLKPGAIYLFHDSNRRLPCVLAAFLEHCASEGYRCVGLDELLDGRPRTVSSSVSRSGQSAGPGVWSPADSGRLEPSAADRSSRPS